MAVGELTEVSDDSVQPASVPVQANEGSNGNKTHEPHRWLKALKLSVLQGLKSINDIIKRLALKLIWIYQHHISPFTPPSCRFHPTCSHYTYQAIERFGLWQGGWLGFCRLCKCHPLHRGGLDLVPETFPPILSGSKEFITKIRKRKLASEIAAPQDHKTTRNEV